MEIVTPDQQSEPVDFARYGRALYLYEILKGYRAAGLQISTNQFDQVPATLSKAEFQQAIEDLVHVGLVVINPQGGVLFLRSFMKDPPMPAPPSPDSWCW